MSCMPSCSISETLTYEQLSFIVTDIMLFGVLYIVGCEKEKIKCHFWINIPKYVLNLVLR